MDNGKKFQGQTFGAFEVYAQAVYEFARAIQAKASLTQIMNQRYRYPTNETVIKNVQQIEKLKDQMLEVGLVPIPDKPITGQGRTTKPDQHTN